MLHNRTPPKGVSVDLLVNGQRKSLPDNVADKLSAYGIPFRHGSSQARRQIFFRDPDGNLIELQPS